MRAAGERGPQARGVLLVCVCHPSRLGEFASIVPVLATRAKHCVQKLVHRRALYDVSYGCFSFQLP